MKKTILVFGLLILALLVLFQLSKYSMISGNLNIEIVIAEVAVVFFIVGVYLNKRSLQIQNNKPFKIDFQKAEDLDITKREYEVLLAISSGFSNKEIAEQLFLSESTIKTHVSNLLVKLNAKRRTQAIQIAKDLKII
jgi:DNA-binding NarL/FixJ family response regulator